MADTAVAITAGTGTNIDTRTESTNSNHRQVVVLGDPSVNAGVAAVDATNGLSVNVTNASLTVGSHAVTNAGTFATQATLAAETTKNIGTVRVGDGTNTSTVKAVSTAPVTATDQALVTVLRPDSPGIIATGSAGSASATVLTVQGITSMTPLIANPLASATASGFTSSRVNAAASTNATSLKASAGNVGEIDVYNAAAYTVFLKLYNKASAPTVGTDTPVWTIPVAAGGGFSKSFAKGKSFATGIAYAITRLQADSDTTVVVAGDLTGSIDWI